MSTDPINKRTRTKIDQDLSLSLAETNYRVQNSRHIGERRALIDCQ